MSLLMFLLGAAAPLRAGSTCDPTTYTDDDAQFADLAVNDFQSEALGSWSKLPESSPMIIDDLGYWGGLWFTTGWCIPGMDSDYPGCGGTNVYLATPMDLHIAPQAPTERVGFRWGTQGQNIDIVVTLDDGTVYSFSPKGQTDFFGYCSPTPIADIHITGPDGGIDDVRYGLVPDEPVDTGDTGDTGEPTDTGDTGAIDEDTGEEPAPGACGGCATGPSSRSAAALLLALGGVLLWRRRAPGVPLD